MNEQKPPTGNGTMQMVLLALAAGFLVGIVFSLIKLPLPAPPALSGVMGIVGIYLGGMAYQWAVSQWFPGQ